MLTFGRRIPQNEALLGLIAGHRILAEFDLTDRLPFRFRPRTKSPKIPGGKQALNDEDGRGENRESGAGYSGRDEGVENIGDRKKRGALRGRQ